MVRIESVGHFDHRMADDLIAQLEPVLEHFYHDVLSQVLVIDVHHGVVEVGIEGLAQGRDWFGAFHLGVAAGSATAFAGRLAGREEIMQTEATMKMR